MTAVPPLTGLHDIIYQILSHLTPDPKAPSFSFDETAESRSARKALCCLARTHSSFTQPALAKMWHSLPSQRPLEHLLCVVGIARRSHKPVLVKDYLPLELCGTLETHGSGWVRFQEYASLVREIIVDPFLRIQYMPCSPRLEDTFWQRLASALGDTPILPRLQLVTIRRVADWSMDAGVLHLLSPFSIISELYIDFPLPSKEDLKWLQRASLKHCVSLMQNLEVLSVAIDGVVLDEDVFLLDMELLPRIHPRLRILKINRRRGPSVELSRLRHLAALPSLTDLTINLHWREPADWSIELQALRNLTVSCTELLLLGSLLARVDAPQLQTLSVTEASANTGGSMAHWQELPMYLHPLATKCPALTAFKWRCLKRGMLEVGYVGERCIGMPLAKLVAPLLSLGAMRHFSVSLAGPTVPYTPADLHAFAEAWPDLETFQFLDKNRDSQDSGEERYADIGSLVAFARHCPRLRSIDLPIVRLDSGGVPEFDSTPSELADRNGLIRSRGSGQAGAPRHWLRQLSVGDIYVSRPVKRNIEDYREDVRRFSALMDEVFPSAAVRIQTESSIHTLFVADWELQRPYNDDS